eukprot:scaffold7166_cov104-Skeletonema_dohrnii-CCMP3373.AAC.4
MMMPFAYLWHWQSTCGCSAFNLIPTSRASNNTINNNCNTTKITQSMSRKEEQPRAAQPLLLLAAAGPSVKSSDSIFRQNIHHDQKSRPLITQEPNHAIIELVLRNKEATT